MNLLATLPIVLMMPVWVVPKEVAGENRVMIMGLMIALCSLVLGIILVIGAARMLDLQSYRIAMFAAVVAVLPGAVGFPISLPFGVWALTVLLSRRDMRTAFAGESEREQMPKEPDSAIGWTMPVGLMLGLSLGAAIDINYIGVYMSLGMIFGIVCGAAVDRNNRRKSKD